MVARSRHAGGFLGRCSFRKLELSIPRFGCYFGGAYGRGRMRGRVRRSVTGSGVGVLFFKGVGCGGKVSVLVRAVGTLPRRRTRGLGVVVTNGSFSKAVRGVPLVRPRSFRIFLGRVGSSRLMFLCGGASCMMLPCEGASRDKVLRVTFCFGGPVVTDGVPCFGVVLSGFGDFKVLASLSVPSFAGAFSGVVRERAGCASCCVSARCDACAGERRVASFSGRFSG